MYLPTRRPAIALTLLLMAAVHHSPSAAQAPPVNPDPWFVTLSQTLDPLAAGFCGAIHLTVFDRAGGEVPRNPLGVRVTMADFDIAVASPDGISVTAQQIDASHWTACACQGASAGAVGTVTATYPSQKL